MNDSSKPPTSPPDSDEQDKDNTTKPQVASVGDKKTFKRRGVEKKGSVR